MVSERTKSPDLDRRAGGFGKKAGMTSWEEDEQRKTNRAETRGLDEAVSSTPGIHHMTEKANRIYPADANKGAPSSGKQRPVAGPGQSPASFSGRQRDARAKTSGAVKRVAPTSEIEASKQMLVNEERHTQINNALSRTQGDITRLPKEYQDEIKRVDSFVQRYERRNDRGHVVWVNASLPNFVNRRNLDGYMEGPYNEIEEGAVVEFDRYTVGAHDPAEAYDAKDDPAGRRVMLQIQTRRGAYVGQSSNGTDTTHLLPRAMNMIVTGKEKKTIDLGDGRREEVWVATLTDNPNPETY